MIYRWKSGVRAADAGPCSDAQRHSMAEGLAETVIKRHKRRRRTAKRITIDLDPSKDPAHGCQQLWLFNRFYDCNCYLPWPVF